ncbi:MAG: hypothetical protein EOO42_00515 [Flavobacteriales bacterium]|nr:MAG: hypothetical protein EOO42_00515 [Flavobacteriales bacterium]
MKNLLFLLLFITSGVFAQDSVLTELNGIEISYKLTKLSDDEKKDSYLIVVKATNVNMYDAFYQAPKGGVNHFFVTVTIRNVNKEVSLTGNESRLLTSDGKLYYLKPFGSVSVEKKFKIDKGIKPVLTPKFLHELTSIAEIR